MVGFVEQMLALHKKLNSVKMPREKEMIQCQIEMVDSAIDRLEVHCICKMRCTPGTILHIGFGDHACFALPDRQRIKS